MANQIGHHRAAKLSPIPLGGAFTGSFPLYELRVRVPSLGFDRMLRAVGIPRMPVGFAGIAAFAFLNRFGYGNFADPDLFGLEL